MRRRDFLRAFCRAVAVWPVSALAQQTKMHRVAFVASTSPVSELTGADPINPAVRAFAHGLRSLGYVEGQNLVMEWRTAEGRFERFPEIIRELVSIKADVIVASVNPMIPCSQGGDANGPHCHGGHRQSGRGRAD